MGPCVAYCLCSRVGSVAVAVPAPTICFAPLSIVTAGSGVASMHLGNTCGVASHGDIASTGAEAQVWRSTHCRITHLTVEHCAAEPMHCPTTTRPSKKLRDHRRYSSGMKSQGRPEPSMNMHSLPSQVYTAMYVLASSCYMRHPGLSCVHPAPGTGRTTLA